MKGVMAPPPFDIGSIDPKVLEEGPLRKMADEFDREHYHWQEVYYHTPDKETAEAVWSIMKLSRELSASRLDLCGRRFVYNLTPGMLEDLHYIDRDAAGRIEARLSGKADAQRYLVSSLMEEAIASSQIEGASTTRKVAKKMLRSRTAPKDLSERMILNNYLAMEDMGRWKELPLTPALIMEMHKVLTDSTLRDGSDWEGRFRESDDIVVGDPLDEDKVYHVPPPSEGVPGLIDALCAFANDDSAPMHPVLKAIVLHYMIGYIHPFVDGNGRTARCLFYWYSMKKGYWLLEYTSISAIIKKSRGKYGEAYQFTESDSNDLTYFMKYNLGCIRRSIDSLTSYLDRKSKEQRAAVEMIDRDADLNLVEASIVKELLREGGIISVYDVQSEYHLAYESARKYVHHLVDRGYLKVVGKSGKRVLYSLDRHDPAPGSNDRRRITTNYHMLVQW